MSDSIFDSCLPHESSDLSRRSFLKSAAGTLGAAALGQNVLDAASLSAQSHSGRSPRSTENWDFDWRFQLGDTPAASQPGFDDSAWRLLDVPHDWGIEGDYKQDNPGGAVSGFLPSGIGWYRKSLEVSPAMLERSVWILFDGVFMDSTVWINGEKLGTRPYGYISFFYDLTGHLHPGTNVIAVRVDNQLQPAARWYTGSGIYGHVHLITANRAHIVQWGTCVRTPKIDAGRATVTVATTLSEAAPPAADWKLHYDVLDAQGQVVAGGAVPVAASAATPAAPFELTVAHPALWSPADPRLYTLRTRLLSGASLLDETETVFGIRNAVFDPNRGFLLNGSVLKIQGVADHLYGGPMAIAIPDSILVRRLQQLKVAGVNAIRTSHNPHTPIFYDLCDRMGILVMNEVFDGWHRKATEDYGARFFKDWWRRDVQDWVLRDRNHPSIILWSIGNETGKSDTFGISQWIHKFDPTRATTGGRVWHGVDVAGLNGESEVPGFAEKFHHDNPTIPMVFTESPHTYQTRGFYRVRTWWRDWKRYRKVPSYGDNQIFFDGNPWFRSSYDNAMVRITARQSWKQVAETPWICGAFRWNGFDYLGEADYKGGRWPDRAKGGVGILDLAGLPKDHYYLYQSLWTSAPMVHLLPTWTNRGMEGIVIPVVAYSNQPQVELFLNGTSLGRNPPGPLGDFVWNVPYHPGTLKAVAYGPKGEAIASKAMVTAGPPVALKLETDNAALKPDRLDTAVTTFAVVDADGHLVPWTMNRVDFKLSGPVRLLGYDNGNPTDVTPNQASWRPVFYGLGRGFYQSTADDGPIEVTAAAILGAELQGAESSRPGHVAIAVNRIALRGSVTSAVLEVRYTTDGSEPTAASALYSQPLQILTDTTVRALVLRDGKPFMTTHADFLKIDPALVSDARWATDSQIDPLRYLNSE